CGGHLRFAGIARADEKYRVSHEPIEPFTKQIRALRFQRLRSPAAATDGVNVVHKYIEPPATKSQVAQCVLSQRYFISLYVLMVSPRKNSGRRIRIHNMMTTPINSTPTPRMNTMPTPPMLEPEPYPGSMDSIAVAKNITSSTTPPNSGAKNLQKKFLALANSSPRKYQTQAKAVSP